MKIAVNGDLQSIGKIITKLDFIKGVGFGPMQDALRNVPTGERYPNHPLRRVSPTPGPFEQCLEMIVAGLHPEASEFQALYQQLSQNHQNLVKAAMRMMPALPNKNNARQMAVIPSEKLSPQQQWIPCAPMPTEMCRVSPFFPLGQKQMKERPFIRDTIITSNSWGEIKYTGPKLSTYEEDVLLAVLILLDGEKNRFFDKVDGRPTYTYRGPLLPVVRLLGCTRKSYGQRDYTRVIDALHLMTEASVALTVHGRTARGKQKERTINITNMLVRAKWDKKRKKLTVTVNPYFYEMYANGPLTLIDVAGRAKLKSPVAKALLRFVQSHWQQEQKPTHFLTLAKALNLNLEQPPQEIRRLFKRAITELINRELLTDQSGVRGDYTKLVLASTARTNGRP